MDEYARQVGVPIAFADDLAVPLPHLAPRLRWTSSDNSHLLTQFRGLGAVARKAVLQPALQLRHGSEQVEVLTRS